MNNLPDELFAELMATFSDEVTERLEAANRHMLVLEATSDAGGIAELGIEIFREVHSLKGAAGALGLKEVEKLAHRLESLFEPVRDGTPLPAGICDVVYESLDAIGALVNGPDAPAPGIDVDGLITRLDASEAPPESAVPVNPPAKPPALRAGAPGKASPGKRTRPRSGSTRPASGGRSQATATAVLPHPGRDQDERTPVEAAPQLSGATPGTQEGPVAAAEPARLAEDSVRVATAKLDALMAQVGELMVVSVGAEERVTEVGGLFDNLTQVETAWRELRPSYQKLARELAIDPDSDETLSTATTVEMRSMLAFLQWTDERGDSARRQLADLRRNLGIDQRRMAQVVSDLQDEVRHTRMLPVATIFSSVPRLARDLARKMDKEVAMRVVGDETEVDRSVLEQLKSPINHLVRNALDHGVELPQERVAAGKPARATVTLSASQRGDSLVVEMKDDGGGIDLERVKARAVKKGLLLAEESESLGDREAADLIFHSGLSTSSKITDVSGRGVGMDVVRQAVESMNGIIEVETESGTGTTFSLIVPLSVATTRCLLVRCGAESFALPISNVARIMRVAPEEVGLAQGRETVQVDDRAVPLVGMSHALDIPGASIDSGPVKRPVVVLGSVEKRVAFGVDELLGAQEIVVKSLPNPLTRVPNVAGASIMAKGDVILVLNVSDLVRAVEGGLRSARHAVDPTTRATVIQHVVLVADDSIVTRTLEKNILESAGFTVRVASDGLEAWEMLQQEKVDLVVTDIEMPRLDGFGLTARIRDHEQLRDLPIVLVTSLDSRENRERGVKAGADAHIVKQSFNQDTLLETIRRLI